MHVLKLKFLQLVAETDPQHRTHLLGKQCLAFSFLLRVAYASSKAILNDGYSLTDTSFGSERPAIKLLTLSPFPSH
jgi:hypothetical protein